MKKLYSGFDLCAPSTSVSMTINGPAPMILAMYMNTAIDQRVERFLRDERPLAASRSRAGRRRGEGRGLAGYRGELPPDHDGAGLGLLGCSGRKLVELGLLTADEYARLRAEALTRVRGTVQADILKEDQAQNTCIFSTEFALRMMGDVQQFFSDNDGARISIRCRSPAITSPKRARTPSRSSRSRSPMASPSSSTTWRAA